MNLTEYKEPFELDLLSWYALNHRKLSFRQDQDPYKIWVSEIMAQQTRIEAMLPYFERFIKKYPDVKALSEAQDDELMKLWQGLGYYSRARSMKKAALQIMDQYGGDFPLEKSELMKLAGIGDYTAGAIASIAGHKRASAVDGNVIRVFARLLDYDQDVSRAASKKELAAAVEEMLPEAKRCGDFNQALMELGALVCTPKKADCPGCPLSFYCKAYKNSTQLLRPLKAPKKKRSVETKEIWIEAIPVLIRNRKTDKPERISFKIRIRRRDEPGLLHGLYEFAGQKPDENLTGKNFIADLGEYRHIFSHREWAMNGYLLIHSSEDSEQESSSKIPGFYAPVEEIIETYALPGAFMPFFKRALPILESEARKLFDQLRSGNK